MNEANTNDSLRSTTEGNGAVAALLAPIGQREFATKYWGRQPLFLKGDECKFERLFGCRFDLAWVEGLWKKLALHEKELLKKAGRNDIVRAIFDFRPAADSGKTTTSPESVVRPDQASFFFRAGATVPISRVREIDENVDLVARSVEEELGIAGPLDTIVFCSPAGRGVGPHFDGGCSLILQVAGKKRYRVGKKPHVPWPRGKGYVCEDGTISYRNGDTLSNEGRADWELTPFDGEELLDIEMTQGDLLYIPPGTVHTTEATGDHSLGLVLGFPNLGFGMLLTQLIEKLFFERPEWRHIPILAEPPARRGELPRELERFFGERLAELRREIKDVQPNGFELAGLWHGMVYPPPDAAPAAVVSAPVSPDDTLEVARPIPPYAIGLDRAGRMGMRIFHEKEEFEIEHDWVPFFKTLLSVERFAARAGVDWHGPDQSAYEWEVVSEYLSALAARGIVRRVEATCSP